MIDEFSHHHEERDSTDEVAGTELRRLDITTPYFQQRLRERQVREKISERLGSRNMQIETAERVRLELNCATGHNVPLVSFCSQHVFEWFTDRNPHHIDLVMMVCADHGIEPTPTLIRLATEVARARVTGAPAGTPDKLLKEHAKQQAFTLIMNLIYNGASLEEAADKAAQWWRDTYPGMKTGKASSLSKEYTESHRKTGIEKRNFNAWDEFQSDEQRIYWKNVRTILPLADDDLIGTRR